MLHILAIAENYKMTDEAAFIMLGFGKRDLGRNSFSSTKPIKMLPEVEYWWNGGTSVVPDSSIRPHLLCTGAIASYLYRII